MFHVPVRALVLVTTLGLLAAPGAAAAAPHEGGHRREVLVPPEEHARWLAGLQPMTAGPVRLLVPAGREQDPVFRTLAADLGRAAEALAPRVPATLPPDRPLTVAVVEDHVAQARYAGAVGAAVAPVGRMGEGVPDLYLVLHPDDRWAYLHAVARRLLERSEAAEGASPWLLDGAALYLVEGLANAGAAGWYGWSSERWVPVLAAAGVLPDAGDLLRRDPQGDDSEVLWVPAAAAVIAALPGESAAAKLRAADEESVGVALAELWRTAARAPAPPDRPAGAPLPDGFLRGVSFAMLNSVEGGYHAPAITEPLARLEALGADAVSLMPFASQRDPAAPGLRFLNDSPGSETDAGLVHAARVARERGFAVLWKPHLWVGHGSWPGEVAMTSEEDWRAWWRSYRRFVLHHAVLARHAGAELFAVGVELEKTVERRDDWLRLIRDVRRVYPGAVTYAANWGSGADRVSFWDALDVAGVDAYYPLADAEDAGEAELHRGAEEVARRLAAIARRADRPLLLTEVGFAARKAAWREPHKEGGEVSFGDQARAYRVLLRALEGRPWLRGVFVWKAFSGERESWGRSERPDFRFLGRPSEAVVAEFFRSVDREGGAAPGRP